MKATFLLFAAFLAFALPAAAQLSGTYTINPSGTATSTNYLSIEAAVSDLVNGTRNDGGTTNGKGVSGPVVFSIADGSYNVSLTIGAIQGASASSRVTFQSASGDSSKVTLYKPSQASDNNNRVLEITGDYIT